MTEDAEWDPYDTGLAERELILYKDVTENPDINISAQSTVTMCLSAISCVHDRDQFMARLSHIFTMTSASTTTSHRKRSLRAKDPAQKWFIGVETARRTIDRTTQRGTRHFATTSGTRRLKHTAYQFEIPSFTSHCVYRHNVYNGKVTTSKHLRASLCDIIPLDKNLSDEVER